jgi:hypothetical protein
MKPNLLFSPFLLCSLALLLLGALCAPAADGPMVRINHLGDTVSSPRPGIGYTNVGTSVITLFTTNAARQATRTLVREVRNMGTFAVMYAINNTNVSTNSLHGVIAPGTAIRDGLGGKLDLSAVPYPVSFRTATGDADLAILEVKQ